MRLPAFLGDAMADKNNRLYRDPERSNLGKWCNPSQTEINRIGYWTEIDRQEMDAQFRLAMSAAIEAGAEVCATSPSTHFGTRAPIAGHQRD
jgi:hypothetical protein